MTGARQRWTLLLSAFAVTLAVEGFVVAAQPVPSTDGMIVPPGSTGPGYLLTDDGRLMAGDRGNFSSAGPFPPVRLISYPKASCPNGPWYFKAEGVAWRRDSDKRTFARRIDREWEQVYEQIGDPGPANPPTFVGYQFTDTVTTALSTSDFDSLFSGGVRAMIGRRLGDWWGLEVSYLTFDTWTGSQAVSNDQLFVEQQFVPGTNIPLLNGYGNPIPGTIYEGSLFSPFTDFGNPAVEGLDYNNYVRIRYRSQMNDIEWNFRRSVNMPAELLQMSLLVGGRYMTIDEGFNYYSESLYPVPTAVNQVNVSTENDMLGVQVGALFEFRVEPWWWVDTEIKGVLFDNRARMANTGSVVVDDVGNVDDVVGSRSRHCTTWALDLDLSLSWQVNRWLTGRIGYQALWIEGLALASENFQSDIDTLTQGPAQLHDRGKSIYHGPHFGLTGAW